MNKRIDRVEQYLEEAQRFRTVIEKLCNVQDTVILVVMGLEDGESHVFEFNSSDKSTDPEDAVCVETTNVPLSVSFDLLEQVLKNGNYNWFEIVEYIEKECNVQEVQQSAIENTLTFFTYTTVEFTAQRIANNI